MATSSSLINRGKERNTNSNPNSMHKLWDEINQTRLSIEKDQADYERTRHEIESINEKMQTICNQNGIAERRIKELDELHATRATELSHYEIKDKVINESITKVQEELKTAWDELSSIRKNAMQLSNQCLRESCEFGMKWNCTELGRKNRAQAHIKDLEELRQRKLRLEYDLEEFLTMLNRVRQSEQEKIELENQYRNQEDNARRREAEAYKILQETVDKLENLQKQQNQMDKELEDEVNKLQQKLQQSRESISYWERRVSENQRVLSFQRNKQETSDRTSDENAIRFGNPQSITCGNVSATKYARIYQPVRPTPQITQQSRSDTNQNNRVLFQKQSITATKPQQQTSINTDIKGNFRNSDNQNQNSMEKSGTNQVSLSSSTIYPSNNTNNTNKSTAAVVAASGRVFQFKKKSIENDTTTICGPTNRSVTVTLGTTPFSSFQNSRSVLQQQHTNQKNL